MSQKKTRIVVIEDDLLNELNRQKKLIEKLKLREKNIYKNLIKKGRTISEISELLDISESKIIQSLEE